MVRLVKVMPDKADRSRSIRYQAASYKTLSTRPAWSDTAQGWRFQEEAQYGARDATASELAGPRQLAVDDLGIVFNLNPAGGMISSSSGTRGRVSLGLALKPPIGSHADSEL